MGAGCPVHDKPPGLQGEEHVLHAAGRFGGDFFRRESLCHDLDTGHDLHPVLEHEVHVGGGERAAGIRPADDRFDLCDPVTGRPAVEHAPAAHHRPDHAPALIGPMVGGMPALGEDQVRPGRVIPPATEDDIAPLVQVGFSCRVKIGGKRPECCSIAVLPVERQLRNDRRGFEKRRPAPPELDRDLARGRADGKAAGLCLLLGGRADDRHRTAGRVVLQDAAKRAAFSRSPASPRRGGW